jgi:hypothetical protein
MRGLPRSSAGVVKVCFAPRVQVLGFGFGFALRGLALCCLCEVTPSFASGGWTFSFVTLCITACIGDLVLSQKVCVPVLVLYLPMWSWACVGLGWVGVEGSWLGLILHMLSLHLCCFAFPPSSL